MKRYNHINGVDNLIKIFSIKKYYCNDFKGRISYLLFAFLYLVKNYRLDLNFFTFVLFYNLRAVITQVIKLLK